MIISCCWIRLFISIFSADVLEKNYALFSDAKRIKSLDLNSFAELMKAFYNFDIRDQLKTIKVPSLVVVGELDLN